jgi:hypothetical protein
MEAIVVASLRDLEDERLVAAQRPRHALQPQIADRVQHQGFHRGCIVHEVSPQQP